MEGLAISKTKELKGVGERVAAVGPRTCLLTYLD